MSWLMHLFKLLNLILTILGTALYYSISTSDSSYQVLLLLLSLILHSFLSLLHSIFHNPLHEAKLLPKLLFFFKSHKTSHGRLFTLKSFALGFIVLSAVISSALISFSCPIWNLNYFFALIPVLYLLKLVEFVLNPTAEVKTVNYFRVPLIYASGIIEGFCLLMLYEIDLKDQDRVLKITVVLTVFASLLCTCLYRVVLAVKSNQALASFMTCGFFGILAFAIYYGSGQGDLEMIKISIFLATAIPLALVGTNVYFSCDLSSELKNSIFLGIWTILYVPSMALVSKDYIYENEKLFCNAINFSFLCFGFYSLSLETFFRFQKIQNRESKNTLLLCCIIIPVTLATFFYSYNNLPIEILIILLCIILIFFSLILLLSIPVLFIRLFTSRLSPSHTDSILKYEDSLTLVFSVLWKLVYMLGVCFLTRKIYFFDYKDSSSNYFVVSQGLLTLISAMIHSALLENVNFFVLESGHKYPSTRKISLVDQLMPSLLKESLEPVKNKWQKVILGFFVLAEAASLACLALSYSVYFIIIFNLATGVMFFVAFETKLKTWDRGNKISAEFLVFVWTCIYTPCVCGSSVISTSSIAGNIDNTSSLIIFFIIIAFCIQLGLSSGEVYDKISSFKYVYMNLMLKDKGYDINYRNLIIEDYKNKNFENFGTIEKGSESFDEYIKEHFLIICDVCRRGDEHDTPTFYYEVIHSEFWRTLLLRPSAGVIALAKDKKKDDEEEREVEHEHEEVYKLEFNDDKLLSYRKLFRMGPKDETVKKFNFLNALARVYRKKITKQEVKRDDFFMIFLQVTHNISMQVLQKFDEEFIRKVLIGIANLIYGESSEKTLMRVDQEILTGKYKVTHKKHGNLKKVYSIAAQASKMYLNANVTAKNRLDDMIPYSLMSFDPAMMNKNKLGIKEFLDELNKEPDEFTADSIEGINNSIQIIFFASIFNMYSLTSVALSGKISWLQSKLSLSTGIIPSESSWIVSVILSFSLIFTFLILTLALFILIKYKKTSPKMIKFGKSFMVIIASGLLVENLIFLLSNLICESTNGNLHLQNNEDIECMSPIHIGLLSTSIILFILYFFLVQVFYPSFHKLSTKIESYFNIEIHCKVIYAAIASCISNDLLGFKLVLCLVLVIVLIVYSIYRITAGTGNVEKFRHDLKEYLIVVWIYVWALVLFNGVAASYGFYILIVTIGFYSIYGQRKFLLWLFSVISKLWKKREKVVVPDIEEKAKLSDDDQNIIPVSNNRSFIKDSEINLSRDENEDKYNSLYKTNIQASNNSIVLEPQPALCLVQENQIIVKKSNKKKKKQNKSKPKKVLSNHKT